MAKKLFHARSFFRLAALVAFVLAAILTGCAPSIGDECESRGDCPSDAICDVTISGGYCTVPNCELGGCPEDSVCVIFDQNTRFCMAICEDASECRNGHDCRQDNNFEGEPFGYCYEPAAEPSNND